VTKRKRREAEPMTQTQAPAVATQPESTTDPDCIFCKIVTGEVPSRRIYEDEHCVAFLDMAAWHRGHALVVPRRHVPDMITGTPSLPEIAPAIDHVARMLITTLAADGINLLSSAREVAGQEVFHMHVHVVPRYADEPGLLNLINRGPVPDGELESVYRQIQGSR
jgi:histidine triad (HIT) family protein